MVYAQHTFYQDGLLNRDAWQGIRLALVGIAKELLISLEPDDVDELIDEDVEMSEAS